jgi:hypothetical protein
MIGRAKRAAQQHPVIIAAAVIVVAGGAAGATVAFNSSGAVQPAAPCPVTGGYYAYAIPQDPADPPAAGSDATNWRWTPRGQQVKVGDQMRLNGRLWQVTQVVTMPGVEPVGRPFAIVGWLTVGRHVSNPSLTMCGRLVFRPVN